MRVIRSGLFALAAVVLLARVAGAGIVAVPANGDLQSALDRARPGDVVTLQAGATYTGNFTLGVKAGSAYITVRSSAADDQLPGAGSRVTPAAAAHLARLVSPNAQPALKTAPGAHHWRLLALEFAPGPDGTGDMIRLGDGSGDQHTVDVVPHDLVIDRCYVHGSPDAAQKRGIALNSAATTIRNSWISDIKASGQDSQAIAGWNGPGPFVIENNYLEASGENFLLGGADPSIDGLVPTGITFRDNWVRKPTAWRSGPWQVKNLLELKNARGVVVENNLFENNWQGAQNGFAILFTPRNQDGGAPWTVVQDVTFRSNVVRHVAAAINILGHDSPNASQQTRGVTVSNNLFYDVNGQTWGGSGTFVQIGDGPATVTMEHNTVLQTGTLVTVYGGTASSPAQVSGFVFRDNVALNNDYGIKGDNYGVGNATISAYFPAAIVTGNVIAGAQSSQYPGGNSFPTVSQLYAQFTSPSADDYQLSASSSYLKAATNGGAVGADWTMMQSVVKLALNGTAGSGRPEPLTATPAGSAKPKIGG